MNEKPEIARSCNLCGASRLQRYRRRADGLYVFRCPECGMGVVEQHPADLSSFYGDTYYHSSEESAFGYSDYPYTAEHAVGWAASLIRLLAPRGRILDIGCGDGHLLNKLRSSHECYGIEVNSAMAERCRGAGITMLASDIYDEALLPAYQGFFDVVSALAVFEHVRDFKRAVGIALELLSADGILLFEVPFISTQHPSDVWFQSSLEHVYYPDERSLRYLFETVFQVPLVGGEAPIADYGSVFVGVVTKNRTLGEELAKKYQALVWGPSADLKGPEERCFRFWLDLVHRAYTTPENLQLLPDLPLTDINPLLLKRLADLWQRDVQNSMGFQRRIEQQANQLEVLTGQIHIYDSSPLMRLRNTIMEERMSLRKLLKTAWLLGLLVAPKSLRERMETKRQRMTGRFAQLRKSLRARKRTHKVEQQEKWPEGKPLLSVIIPCYNYGRFIKGALDSLTAQTFQDFEILIIDAGSTDPATLNLLHQLDLPRTKIYFREGRHLLGDNRNFGIERAQGKYVCSLDPDDMLLPTYFEKALFLLENYHYDIVSPSLQTFEGSSKQWIVPTQPTLERIIHENQFSVVAIYLRKMWEAAGGFRDWGLGSEYVYEDWEMWVRAMANGARARNIPEKLMLYRVHKASLSQNPAVAPANVQAQIIREHNAQCLTPENFRRSRQTNATDVEVQNANLNLCASFAKTARKPRVLFALPFMTTGGGEIMLLNIAEHLKENGFDLCALTTIPTDESCGDTSPRFEEITREIYHLHRFLEDERDWEDFVFYLIESKRIDGLFLAGCGFLYPLLPELKKRFPRLWIVDQLFNEFGHIENNRKYAAFIDVNTVTSAVIRDVLVNRYKESEDKIQVIVNGVDVEGQFNPDLVTPLSRKGVPGGEFLVTFAGRFSEEKCPERFVEIASLLVDEPNVRFLMLGGGPQFAAVRNKIAKLGLKDRIELPGFVEVAPFLKSSGALVVCSDIDGTPLAIMEALSMGLPVVASKVGGIPTLIRDGYNGFLCEPSDVHGFAQAIRRIANDASLRDRLRRNAREYAVSHLNVSVMNQQYLDLFTTLTAANGSAKGKSDRQQAMVAGEKGDRMVP